MPKLDLNSIKLKLSSQRGATDKMLNHLDKIAQKRIDSAKKELIETFLTHPVSEEIEEGASAENLSGTLDGKGNLWGFIGFPDGSEPIKDVENILSNDIFIQKRIQGRDTKGRFKDGGSKLLFDYRINVPSKDDFAEKTPLPWETTKSWLFGIERGISGFGAYIYWKLQGRSGAGIQAKTARDQSGKFQSGDSPPMKLRSGSFHNVPYFSAMYKKFIDSFK